MIRLLAVGTALYLLVGAAIAAGHQPQQLWACADASAPHGEVLYADPPVDGCRPTVTTGERVGQFVSLTLFGLPLALIKGANGD